jgi:hypothetical protein
MHGSRGATVSYEQLDILRQYLKWLQGQVAGDAHGTASAEEADDLSA